jgi:sugar transferase (PEP-CTERM/EpsH1 system associated)
MKILFIAPYVPSPVRVRPYHFIRCLAKEGHLVQVVALVSSEREREDARLLSEIQNVSVSQVHLPSWRPWVNCALAMLKGESLWVSYGRNSRFAKTIRGRLEAGGYDVIHVEHVRSLSILPLLEEVKARPRRPGLILDSVDCISGLLSQYAERSASRLRRLLYWREVGVMRAFEPSAASLFDRVVITSEPERRTLAGLMAKEGWRVEVVPNGVDLEYFSPSNETEEEDTLLFSGRMSFYNNAEAARYFIAEIFPLIKAENPAAKFILAGADPPADLLKLGERPDIEVTGYVDDLRPYLRRASVVVCPMLTAVGIQNKVLEAMAMGKPVVATPVVCQPLSARQGEEILAAEEEGEFAEKVLMLMRRADLRREMGQRARTNVQQTHNWVESTRRLVEIYETCSAEACA